MTVTSWPSHSVLSVLFWGMLPEDIKHVFCFVFHVFYAYSLCFIIHMPPSQTSFLPMFHLPAPRTLPTGFYVVLLWATFLTTQSG